MALKEYENLTPSELEIADHLASVGDHTALRQYRELSKSREPGKYQRSGRNERSS